MAKLDLSVVIVSYNVRELLQDCLESVFANMGELSVEILIVDNASSDDSVGLVVNHFPRVKLIQNPVNLGFAAACNQALERARGQYLLLLNPDTRVLGNAFDRMIQFMDNHPEAAGVGCKLLNGDGSLQPSCRSFPNLVQALVFAFGLYKILPRMGVSSNRVLECWDHTFTREVDYVIGAAFMVRRAAVEQVGLLDPNFFLYAEEKDWCYRVRQAGYKIYFLPDAEIIHYGGRSSEHAPIQSLNRQYESQAKFVQKHYSRAYGTSIYSLLLLGLLIRTVIWWLLTFFPLTNNDIYRQKASAHWIVAKRQLTWATREFRHML